MMTLVKKLIPALVITTILSGCSVGEAKQTVLATVGQGEEPTVVAYIDGTEVAYEDITQEIEIIYSDLGFEPDVVEVKPGSLVTFINHSSTWMWIKSQQEFFSDAEPWDQGASVKIGHEYSFVFTESGSWAYLNHLSTKHEGQIEVVE
jgi:plastocyanin